MRLVREGEGHRGRRDEGLNRWIELELGGTLE